MKILDGKVEFIRPKKHAFISNDEGIVICSCGKEYDYDRKYEQNVAECYNKIVPVCPVCNAVPESTEKDK